MDYSIEDVAKSAGVSITTVSRVINRSEHRVSDATRKKVEKAIKELNYKPNISAQTLRQTYSNVIAFITRDLADPYYGEMARGITETALKNDVLSFICNTGRKADSEMNYHQMFNRYRVRGLILGGGGYDTKDYRATLQQEIKRYGDRGLRIVALAPQGIDIDSVMIDNIKTSKLITTYLLEKGHHRILYAGGPENVCTAKERFVGYKEALKNFNIPVQEELVLHTKSTWMDGYTVITKALKEKLRFTAICCDNDNVAISAIRAIKDFGLRVPEDISVIGIGGLPNSLYSSPMLTTAKIPLYDIGAKAVEMVLAKKEYSNLTEHVLFTTAIQEGNSVKSLK